MIYQFIIILFLFPILLNGQVNRALFVAIDEYPQGSGWEWQNIHATNDSLIIIPMLLKHGYLRKNIKILANSRATKKPIVHALTDIYNKSAKGDYIYIHFSCHGQQMIDNDGDEEDGLDEALIPYDAPRIYTKEKYEGENHLRDDELGKYLELIRAKIGSTGNITVLLDACHSGTGTRTEDEDEYIRGTSYIFGSEGAIPPKREISKFRFSHKTDKNLCPITIFSACQDEEINHEYKDLTSDIYYGALSYAISRVIPSATKKISAQQLFKLLKEKISSMFAKKKWSQTPYHEATDNIKIFRLGK